MRHLFIVFLLIYCSCNSSETPSTKTTGRDSDYSFGPLKDTIPVNTASSKIDIETFGPLKLGMPFKDLVAGIGHPGSKADPVDWAADGLVHQDWSYPALGLVLNVSFEKDALIQTGKLYTITATPPCNYKTAAGLSIGSSYADVEAAYKKDIDPEATDKTQITVGSVYGGIIFSFKNDKAEKIFLGAEAE